MQISLTKADLERFVAEKVQAGTYPSVEAVVEEALSRLRDDESSLSAADVAAIKEADEQYARGEFVEWSEVKAALREKYSGK